MGPRSAALVLATGVAACGTPGTSATSVELLSSRAAGERHGAGRLEPGGKPVEGPGARGAPGAWRHPGEGVRPVVVELFTSEGCSSCPPADRVLMQLHEAGAGGVPVIALEHHVDYWNELGWEDPFSSGASTARQRAYRAARRSTTIFTPEAVVDGVRSLNGSDGDGLAEVIAGRAHEPALPLRVVFGGGSGSGERVEVVLDGEPSRAARLHVAVVEHGLITRVPRGENAGRTLAHGPVVRWFHDAGRARAGATVVRLGVPMSETCAVVAIVQAEEQGEILGAAVHAAR